MCEACKKSRLQHVIENLRKQNLLKEKMRMSKKLIKKVWKITNEESE